MRPSRPMHRTLLAAVLLLAAGLRVLHLGRLSLWYDEVVSMRLARQADPAALLRLLDRIDATRAPLHPLILQGWIALFGPSDLSGRSSSALFGILTVAAVYWLGREAFDRPTALWAAWLAGLSPILVRYAQEVRMYAWLTLVTCLSWGLLLSFRRSSATWRQVAYAASLIALAYSHPLGLVMIAAEGLAYWVGFPGYRISRRRWLMIQVAAALAVAPWIGRYVDHPPESTVGRQSFRMLLGTPIAFLGGDFRFLIVCLGVVAVGALAFRKEEGPGRRVRIDRPAVSSALLAWLVVPPVALYAYSSISDPIFGPARYTMFVAPAYFLMIARGLVRLPRFPRIAFAGLAIICSAMLLRSEVYGPELKADWRAAAGRLRGESATVVVVPAGPGPNLEVETARYYLAPFAPRLRVISLSEALGDPPGGPVVLAIGDEGGRGDETTLPAEVRRRFEIGGVARVPGLALVEAIPSPAPRPDHLPLIPENR